MTRKPTLPATILVGVALAWPTLAGAQYKVVEADGRITYTDRPPLTGGAKVTEMRRASAAALDPSVAALPIELRLAVQRYPVQLFTAADCPPCEQGRKLLSQRGVPFSERKLVTEEESLAAERSIGWRTVPSLMIGTQALRGYSTDEWSAYLDAAGYPRESRLPKNWPAAPATAKPAVESASSPEAPRR